MLPLLYENLAKFCSRWIVKFNSNNRKTVSISVNSLIAQEYYVKSKFSILIVVALFILISENSYALSFTKEISQQEVQKILDKKFPITKKKLFINSTFSDPLVSFVGKDNRVGVATNVKVILPGNIASSGSINLNGSLRYENESGCFFLDNIVIDKIAVNGLSAANTARVEKLLEPVVKKALQKMPVYKFKDDLKHQLAKAILKSVSVKEQLLLVELGV